MAQLITDTVVLDLVEHVYAAGCDPALWPTFVNRIHALVPNGTCHILLDVAGTLLMSNSAYAGFDEGAVKSYVTDYHAINPYNKIFALLTPGRVFTSGELGPPGWLMHEEFFHDWLKPAGDFSRGVGVVLARDAVRQLRITIDLPERLAHLEPECANLLRRLTPHITRAFEVNSRLQASVATTDALARMFDQIADAAVIVGLHGTIIAMNTHADQLLRSGILVRLHNGKRLAFCNPDQEQAYRHALRDAHDSARTGAPFAFPVPNGLNSNGLVLVLPLRRQRESMALSTQQPLAMVIIRTQDNSNQPPKQLLQTLYGLSRAESEVALLILAGLDTREAAEQQGVAHTTLRNQLASVMFKLGVKRQAQLVARILELTPQVSLNRIQSKP